MKITFIVFFYFLGIVFEFLTESMWNYNKELFRSPLTLKRKDINLLFGLGWCGMVILSLSLGKAMSGVIPIPVVCGVLGFLIIGNFMETLYYYFGLWTYNTSHPLLKFPAFVGKYIVVYSIPLSVRLGYVVNGVVAFYANYFLKRWFPFVP